MKRSALVLFGLLLASLSLKSQDIEEIEIIKKLPATPVKNQQMTGTCWCFATISFIESEAIRQGKGELDLSEMYIVRNAFVQKGDDYVRYHGKLNFSEGGQAHDVLNIIREKGLVPQDAYTGMHPAQKNLNHSEMHTMLQSIVKNIVEDRESKIILPIWREAYISVLDVYMGQIPNEVALENKTIAPKTYAKDVVGFNPDDYVELTSYNHHPWYKKMDLEVPDNWSHDLYYNLPIEELMQVINNSIEKGYTVCWDGDVSERYFDHTGANAILAYEKKKTEGVKDIQQARQITFNNWSTTDDHLMHITGLAKNAEGTKYYLTKNSWGQKSNNLEGYLYISAPYMELKTIAILVHKDAIPKKIAKKIF